jgi:hypothetical protein
MPKSYVYRMDHDTGFAPNIKYGICTLCGCKKTTIEVWARRGSWVIGIGGNNTGKPDKLIYAMEVEENLLYSQFRKRYPGKSKYLRAENAGTNVLISRKFYYFGDNAIDLPLELEHIIIGRQGCKCVSDEDVSKLEGYLAARYSYGGFGNPNNSKNRSKCGKC